MNALNYAQPTFTNQGLVTITQTSASGTSMLTGATGTTWTAYAYSNQGFKYGAFCSAIPGQTNTSHMIGLATSQVNGNMGATYIGITYAWYFASGTAYIYESGSQISSYGTYTRSTVLSITFDGTNIIYWKDGVSQRTVSRAVGVPLYFGYAGLTPGASVNSVQFDAFGSTTYAGRNIIGTIGTFTGNVCIGTTVNQNCLLCFNASAGINKVISLYSSSTADPATATDFNGFGATSSVLRYQSSTANIGGHQWYCGATEAMRIGVNSSQLKVGINTTNLQNRLGVAGNVGIGSTYVNTAAPTDGLIVEGKVGIGTTSPGSALSFGSPVVNKILTLYDGNSADAVGTATNFYGFGINNATLRYQTDGTSSVHKFYGGATLFATIGTQIQVPGKYYIMGYLAGGTTGGNYISLGSQQTSGGMAVTSSNKLVAPISGLYHFGFNTIMNTTTGRNDVNINVNGGSIVSTLNEDNGTGYHYRSGMITYYLNANDFVQFYCASGTIYNAFNVDSWHTYFFYHVG
jgi:hypothetical protein